MKEVAFRGADEADFPAVVALDATEVRHTSPMDEARLRHLDGLASYHKVAAVDGAVAAPTRTSNGSPRAKTHFFMWTGSSSAATTRDCGWARCSTKICSTMPAPTASPPSPANTASPPNEPSRRLHDKFGFHEDGSQWLGDGAKQVPLQLAKA